MSSGRTFSAIWNELNKESRKQAAMALFADPDADTQRSRAIGLVAAKMNIRPHKAAKLPDDRKAAYIANLAPDEDLARSLIKASLFAHHRPMLVQFLDALGIKHTNGEVEGYGNDIPRPEGLKKAVDDLRRHFPEEAVHLYLSALIASEPRVWSGLESLMTPPVEINAQANEEVPVMPKPSPRNAKLHPDPDDLSPLDQCVHDSIIARASEIKGAPDTAAVSAMVEELLRLNAARPRSYFHKGFLDIVENRMPEPHFKAEDEDRRLWYLCGAIVALGRNGRHDRIVELYEAETLDSFGWQLVPRSLRVAPVIFEALCQANKAGVASRFLSPKMVAYAGMFDAVLNGGTRLLHLGNHLEAEMLLNVLEKSLPHFAAGTIAVDRLHALERRRAHCFRLKRDFHRSEAILAKLAADPEVKGLSAVLTDLAMVKTNFRGLFDVVIPSDEEHVPEFCRAMRKIEVELEAAMRASGEKAHAQYCLGILALADVSSDSRDATLPAKLLDTSVTYILSRGETYDVGDLPKRARFYLSLALAETLDETRTRYALELFVEALRLGFKPPAHLLRRYFEALSIADSESAREAAEAALAELRLHGPMMESILRAEVARRSAAVWDALHQWATEQRSPRRRFEDEQVLLKEALIAQQIERAEKSLDVLESLAVFGTCRDRFLELLRSPDSYEAIWSQSEANWASVHILELCGRYEEAAAVLRKDFHERIWSGEYGARSEAEDIIARIESYGLGQQAVDDLKRTLASFDAANFVPVAHAGENPPLVSIAVVGGDEMQARFDDAIRASIQATLPNVQVQFRHTNWSSNWGEQFQNMRALLDKSDAVVVMRLIRTNLGRTLRKHCPNWIGCSGRSPASIQRAIETAAQFARRKKAGKTAATLN